VDLAGAMLADHDAHPGSFAALRDALTDMADPACRALALLHFQWRLLVDCGFRPELNHDVVTSQDLGDLPAYSFDPRAGGLTQQSGTGGSGGSGGAGGDLTGPGPWRVRKETVAVLRTLALAQPVSLSGDGRNQSAGKPDPISIDRANRLLCVYARAVLERELPTAGFVLRRGA
jgi:recombinational DNA repair protein (RecF pathway)